MVGSDGGLRPVRAFHCEVGAVNGDAHGTPGGAVGNAAVAFTTISEAPLCHATRYKFGP